MDKLLILTKDKAAQTLEEIGAPNKSKRSVDIKRLSSAALFSGARELVIEHAGEQYHLRQTNQGKLILTK